MLAFYFYRMTTDNGAAPCCTDGLWSLAICKPRIRSSASEGDYIIGFAGNNIDAANGIIHIARVTHKERNGSYYDPDSEFRSRPDCIYERVGQTFTQKPNRFHGLSDMDRDLGPNRNHADVLLSREYSYFGIERMEVDWRRHPELRAVLDSLTQGHRVNHLPEVRQSLEDFVQAGMTRSARGTATHHTPSRCNVDDEGGDCRC